MQWDNSRHHCLFGPVSFFLFFSPFFLLSFFLLFKRTGSPESSNLERFELLERQEGGSEVILRWILGLAARGKEWELPREQSSICAGCGAHGVTGVRSLCTCGETVWWAGMVHQGLGPQNPSCLFSFLCLGTHPYLPIPQHPSQSI